MVATTVPNLPNTLVTFSVLSILTHPVADLTAKSPTCQSVIPPRFVVPATETLQAQPVLVVPVMSGVFVLASQSPCNIIPPAVALST